MIKALSGSIMVILNCLAFIRREPGLIGLITQKRKSNTDFQIFLEKSDKKLTMLPIITQIFQKYTSKEDSNHFLCINSKSECGYRKASSTRQSLLLMSRKWYRKVNK